MKADEQSQIGNSNTEEDEYYDEEVEKDVLYYTKIIRPTSTRASCWNYFGFPADNDGNIITRDKLICTLCTSTVSYEKNSSNLKAHLVASHPAYLSTIEPPVRNKSKQPAEKPHDKDSSDYCDDNEMISDEASINAEGEEPEEMETNYMAVEYLNEADNFDIIHEENLTDEQINVAKNTIVAPVKGTNIVHVRHKTTQKAEKRQKETIDYTNSIVSWIVADFLPSKLCASEGFSKFISAITNERQQLPSLDDIDKEIAQRHKIGFAIATNQLKLKLKEKHFSLCFEKWQNYEQITFLTIYIVLIEDHKPDAFSKWTFCTVEPTFIDWNKQFTELTMSNCCVAICDFPLEDDEVSSLKLYLENNDIPAVPCLISVVSSIANKCFSLTTADDTLLKAIDFYNDQCSFIETLQKEPPKIHKQFWLTKFDFLELIYEALSNKFGSDDTELAVKIKLIIECLSPLKVTLETISLEKLALVSLVKPLTQQLMDHHFAFEQKDSQFEIEMKTIIQEDLEKRIINNKFLTIASFLDPRFQNLIRPDDLKFVKSELHKRNDNFSNSLPSETNKNEQDGTTAQSNVTTRKSGTLLLNSMKNIVQKIQELQTLKKFSIHDNKSKYILGLTFFFKKPDTVQKSVDRFEIEINNYIQNVDANLDQCPMSWWVEMQKMYPQLKRLASLYTYAPLNVQKHREKLQNQIDYFDKRVMLSSPSADMLLWLHHHQMYEKEKN